MLDALTALFFLILLYVYGGYLLALRLALAIVGSRRGIAVADASFQPAVTVLITAYNERSAIRDRIQNILAQDYPPHALEVLVASDGSTDGMEEIVERLSDPRVRLYRSDRQIGKTATQNAALGQARGEIIVFTDADSSFDRQFISRIVSVFADPSVGAADGHLLFDTASGNDVAQAQGYYWRYELSLREAESNLGILAAGSGACLATRKALLLPMDPAIGEDCIVPLDVVAQGFRVVHVADAMAFDRMENSPEREYRARVRMTLRNWYGTWRRSELLMPHRYPGIALGLWSHKILRWLSPFFLVGMAVCANVSAALSSGLTSMLAAMAVDAFALAAVIGYIAQLCRIRIPLVGTAYSFVLANVGFLVGVCRALIGHSVLAYRK